MFVIQEYFERDPEKKGPEWGDRIISELRRYMEPLVDAKTAQDNMNYLLNNEDDSYVKDMFKEKGKNSKLSFINLAVVEKYRNILIAERDKAGIHIGLNTVDPSVVDTERKKDIDMLRYRKAREAAISTLRAKIGEPPLKIDKSYFSGNIDTFEEMGLDSEDDENLNYFFATHWRLLQEVYGEIPLNAIVKHNKLKSKITFWCNDILAKKAIAAHVFVNKQSGAFEVKYVAPETIRLIPGQTQDMQDSPAIEVCKTVTVAQLIREIGNEFDPDRDYNFLVSSINMHHARSYTGLYNGNALLWRDVTKEIPNTQNNTALSYSEFMNFTLPLHYIEFKTTNATFVKQGTSVHGNKKFFYIKANQEVHSEFYTKEAYNNEVTYCAYYIPISSSTQRIFKYGPLFHQTVEGGEDEYSNYSICVYKEVGPPAIDIMKPYITIIKKAWVKFEWMVQKAKPRGRTYNYESLVQIASNMIAEGNTASKIAALMKQFEDGINDIYTIPTVNGERVGGGGSPYQDKPNGLDATAKEFLEIIFTCSQEMASDLGLDSLRSNFSPSPNDGYKINMQALIQSRNSTEYVSIMLLNLYEHIGKQLLLMVQDVIKFKTSLAYKFLVTLVGQDTVNGLENSKFAHHRLGTYIDSFNNEIERAEIKELTKLAYINKEIDLSQYLLINAIDNPAKAGMVLAYEKRRQEKLKMQEVQQMHDNSMESEALKHKNRLEELTVEGNLDVKGKEVEGEYKVRVAEVTADANIKRKEMDIDAVDDKVKAKSDADTRKAQEKANLKEQESF